jgi:hypothetical protein
MHVIVVTDYSTTPSIDDVLPSIIQGHTDSKIHIWLDEIKQRQEYFYYENESIFRTLLSTRCKNNHVFFYFTGHGYKNQLVFPPNNSFTLFSILPFFTKEFLIILDCCETQTIMSWPWLMSNQIVHYDPTVKPVISSRGYCIVSAFDTPTTSTHGSWLTRHLTQSWKERQLQWTDLNHVKIFSTHSFNRCVPSWIFGEEFITITPWFIKINN